MSGVGPPRRKGEAWHRQQGKPAGQGGPAWQGSRNTEKGRRPATEEEEVPESKSCPGWAPREGGLGTGSTTTGAAGWQEGSDVCGRVNRHQGTNACAPAEC